jgi:IS30 family transposase
MNHYKHLTLEEREMILKYHSEGDSIRKIALKIDRDKSTVSRELKRNSDEDGYLPNRAEERYHVRRLKCRPKKKLSDSAIYAYVKDKFLNEQWSPEEIEGRLKLEKASFSISYSTIYRGIYNHLFDEPHLSKGNRGAIRKLRHRGKSRHTKSYVERRGKIQISHDIDERPEAANTRSRIGDWEGDTVVGVTGKACIVTLVCRKSRFLLGGKAAIKKSDFVNEVMINALKDQPCETITPDRGKEFSKHVEVTEALDKVQFYFPKPHQPWQRGTNENTNGLLREYFPKGKDITDISDEYIQEIFDKLNKRPRKCLGYRTPYEVFYSLLLHLT